MSTQDDSNAPRQAALAQKSVAAEYHSNGFFVEVMRHQQKCERDAEHFLSLYWGPDSKAPCIELGEMERWLEKNQPLDRWFFVNLIQLAGRKSLEVGYSAHKAAIASAKNKIPRDWVIAEWANRIDKRQSKASFARQHAHLVKQKFGINVGPETIARDWIPKQ